MSTDTPTLRCPKCGGESHHVEGRSLNQLGYLAEDITHVCEACGNAFARGIPQGEFDHPIVEDTRCDACGGRGLVYQLHEGVAEHSVALRFKCEDCYFVWVVEREPVDGALTIGYAEVMGGRELAKPWGYREPE